MYCRVGEAAVSVYIIGEARRYLYECIMGEAGKSLCVR